MHKWTTQGQTHEVYNHCSLPFYNTSTTTTITSWYYHDRSGLLERLTLWKCMLMVTSSCRCECARCSSSIPRSWRKEAVFISLKLNYQQPSFVASNPNQYPPPSQILKPSRRSVDRGGDGDCCFCFLLSAFWCWWRRRRRKGLSTWKHTSHTKSTSFVPPFSNFGAEVSWIWFWF